MTRFRPILVVGHELGQILRSIARVNMGVHVLTVVQQYSIVSSGQGGCAASL
jgi:hypothetical protein